MRGTFLVVLIAAIATLTGCATASKTYTSTGQAGYTINCSGEALSWGACYEKAGELCGTEGYQILARNGSEGAVAGGGEASFFAGTVTHRSLLIQCNHQQPATSGTASALSAVAGDWDGYYVGMQTVAVNIEVNPDGTFMGKDSMGCQLTGRISELNGQNDAFQIAMNSVGRPQCVGELGGKATETSVDAKGYWHHASGEYLYVQVSDGKESFVAELRKQ